MMLHSIGDRWLWTVFGVTVSLALLVDLSTLVRHRHQDATPALRETVWRSIAWVMLALVFNAGLWLYLFWREGAPVATQSGLEFFTAYLLEKSLSVDNLFVILLVFQSFRIPAGLQRRVLLWGVLGAIVFRCVIIFSGTWLVSKVHAVLYLFGAFILWSGVRLLFQKEDNEENPKEQPLVAWLSRHLPVTSNLQGAHFFVRQSGRWWVTPLFIALMVVEASDILFAADSIPAVFGVTLDPFIVFSSNIFAILGLRSLYFLLAYAHGKLDGLQTGVALVLTLTGVKMLVGHWIVLPVGWMLGLIVVILVTTALWGLRKQKKEQ